MADMFNQTGNAGEGFIVLLGIAEVTLITVDTHPRSLKRGRGVINQKTLPVITGMLNQTGGEEEGVIVPLSTVKEGPITRDTHPLSLNKEGDVLIEQKTLTVMRVFLNQRGSAEKSVIMFLEKAETKLDALSTHLLSLKIGISRLVEKRRLRVLVTVMTATVNSEERAD
jgi:hypothetical protein